MVSFFVPGNPVPQGRPRACKIGNNIHMYDPKTSVDWKKIVAQVASLQHNRWCGEGGLKMTLCFYLPWPMSKKMPSVIPCYTNKPDIDNLSKSVQDALTGVCYKDDSQIYSLKAEKLYAQDNSKTGVRIFIEEL